MLLCRRTIAPLGRASGFCRYVQPGQQPLGCKGPCFASLATEVDVALAGGRHLQKSGSYYAGLEDDLERLREDNSTIMGQVADLRKERAEHAVQEGQLVEKMREKGDVRAHGQPYVESLQKIKELDREIGSLRALQLQNSRDVAELKRSKVTIEKTEKVTSLVGQAEEALADGADVSQEVQDGITAVMKGLLQENEDQSSASVAVRKDIEGSLGKMRNLELSLRIRSNKHNAEVDELRRQLVSALFEAQRKNAKLTRIRDTQALNVKEITLLDRVVDKIQRRDKVRKLMLARDKAKMEDEAKALWRDVENTQTVLDDLEAVAEAHSQQGVETVAKLRAPGLINSVTAETGELREKLIAALREEELCLEQLSSLRSTQAHYISLLDDLNVAIKRL